jgi:hypothetical protein
MVTLLRLIQPSRPSDLAKTTPRGGLYGLGKSAQHGALDVWSPYVCTSHGAVIVGGPTG